MLWPDSVRGLEGGALPGLSGHRQDRAVSNESQEAGVSQFPRLNGHCRGWVSAIASGLNHRVITIRSESKDALAGLLPLVHVRGPLFGRFLVSMPYINTGGVWSRDQESACALIDEACRIADELDVRYLELRHEVPVEHPKLQFSRKDKVHMRLELPASEDLLFKSLKSKLRSQVKKSGEYPLTVHWGGQEILSDFYNVFARNMRDLGTPVFPKRLFSCVLKEFGADAELCVVRLGSRPVAGALLVHSNGVTEVPSASSLRNYNRMNANMLMYWNLLKRSVERGSHTFDFGRSSLDSGTYAFKAQWGAVPHPAVWQYYVRKGSIEAMRPSSEGNQRLIRIWQRLPVWFTRLIGPSIVRGIP